MTKFFDVALGCEGDAKFRELTRFCIWKNTYIPTYFSIKGPCPFIILALPKTSSTDNTRAHEKEKQGRGLAYKRFIDLLESKIWLC